jgi:hypothetical protein
MSQLNLFSADNAPGIIELPEGPVIVCYGGGVDSTAMLIAMRRQGITPDLITFADVGGEKPETYEYVAQMSRWCVLNGFPPVTTCKHTTEAATSYNDLTGNCIDNETLPSIAFGFKMKSCSIKWKQGPQDQEVKGCKRGPNKRDPHPLWIEAQGLGIKPTKLLGYDAGPADLRRSKKLKTSDSNFEYRYPLQQLGMAREDCIALIIDEGLPVPVKSACFFCPASQKWELYWLAGKHPELFEKALQIEVTAMTGHHTRFDEIEMGAGFMELIGSGKRWPSTSTTVGLGCSFAWNHWARMNKVVDDEGKVIASPEWCLARANKLKAKGGNAADLRTC